MSAKVIDQQNIPDMAIQQCGSVLAAFDMAMANGLSVTSVLTPGMELMTPATIYSNPDVIVIYVNKNICPATDILPESENSILDPQGISYWTVNVDFIVQ